MWGSAREQIGLPPHPTCRFYLFRKKIDDLENINENVSLLVTIYVLNIFVEDKKNSSIFFRDIGNLCLDIFSSKNSFSGDPH